MQAESVLSRSRTGILQKYFVRFFIFSLSLGNLLRLILSLCHLRFYVDELHAHGHSNCSSASFIAPAMAVDPELRKLNSSAAECAHSTINRIRKSLRYMKEGNAILLMNSMIHAWNRKILRKLLAGRVATVG
jgi:hypothetical protein